MSEASHRYGLFRKRLEAFTRELPSVERGSVEALHRTRVASRRLRELMPLMGLDRETTRKLTRRLRAVTRRLGLVREMDVLLLLVDELDRSGRYPSSALKRLNTAIARARSSACDRVAAKLPAGKLARLADRLERVSRPVELVEGGTRHPRPGDAERAWSWALDARLAHRAAIVRSAIEATGALYVAEHLHDVRIALKKLRYTAELSWHPRRRRMTADVAALKAAQDVLGRLHDLEVLVAWGREVQASLFPPDLTAWRDLGALVHAVEQECRELHGRYMRDRVKLLTIVERLGAGTAIPAAVGRRTAG